MVTDAFDMVLVHRVFRTELRAASGLIRTVRSCDRRQAAVVADHLEFLLAGLHHHHMAEDELLWPALRRRAPASVAAISRMVCAHHDIAAAVVAVQESLRAWGAAPRPASSIQLETDVDDLSRLVDDHLEDEERHVIPLINEHITPDEWRKTTARGAEFMSKRNVRLGLVMGGMVLDGLTADERRRFLAEVPVAQRTLVRLLASRTLTAYRSKLNAGSVSSSPDVECP